MKAVEAGEGLVQLFPGRWKGMGGKVAKKAIEISSVAVGVSGDSLCAKGEGSRNIRELQMQGGQVGRDGIAKASGGDLLHKSLYAFADLSFLCESSGFGQFVFAH